VSRKHKHAILTVVAFFAFLCHCLAAIPRQPSRKISIGPTDSLAEVREKKRALLLVFRSGVIDTTDNDRAMIEFALKADPQNRRYRLAYETIAAKLNNYIRKYKSMTAAAQLSDADYIIFFNLLEYRRILNTTYPYGELFVIVKGTADQTRPHIVWKSKKIQWAGDAVNNLIKDLKSIRGEV
jgi:hypothetical protein